jgi:FMN reductase
MSTLSIVTVVGNPKPGSRTLTAALALTTALTTALARNQAAGDLEPAPADPIDLATIADGLLAPWRLSPTAAIAAGTARSAGILVLATPTYKASYTGLLKLFLDTIPAGSLAGTVVVPLTVAGAPAHRHLADLQLRPVVGELGAALPAPSLLLEESDLSDLATVVESYADRHAAVIGATAAALRPLASPVG